LVDFDQDTEVLDPTADAVVPNDVPTPVMPEIFIGLT